MIRNSVIKMISNLKEAITKIRTESKKRNFNQSIDLIINLKNLDLKKPENRFNANIQLPYSVSKKRIGIIGDVLSKKASDADVKITGKQLNELIADKKKAKELFSQVDYLIAEAPLMPTIAKEFGIILGPRNMMPKPLPVEADPNGLINSLKKTITLKLKDAPVLQCKVGHEKMEDSQIKENIETILSFVKEKLPKGEHNFKNIKLKLTMGFPTELK